MIMKDPQVQEAVNKLKAIIAELNTLNEYFYSEGVSFSISEKSGNGAGPKTFDVSYLNQVVKYD